MAAANLLALLDDIATLMDDITNHVESHGAKNSGHVLGIDCDNADQVKALKKQTESYLLYGQ